MPSKFQFNNHLFAWVIWVILTSILLGLGLFLVIGFGLPFEQARQMADGLSRDGSLDVFSRDIYQAGKLLWLLGCAFLVGFGGLIVKRRPIREFIAVQSEALLSTLVSDSLILFGKCQKFFADRLDQGILVGSILLSIANRAVFLSKPMGHDEAYTVMAFAIRPLRYLIADYHLPNNHVLHTILVHLSLLFGKDPWIVRFPAFFAGVLLVPVGYIAGRHIFNNRWAGLLSAALISVAPELISFSTNARGYTFICLFTLLIWITADFIRQHKNLAGWVLLTLFSTLGFYTIPIMVYPAGMVYGWLFFSMIVGDISATYQGKLKFLTYLMISGVSGAVITLILYTPIFIVSGFKSLFSNSFVASLSWRGFVAGLPIHLGNAWEDWIHGIPEWVVWGSAGCFLIAMLFHKKLTRQVVPFPLVGIIWIGALLYYQRVVPVSRVWLFALPLYLIYVAGGWAFLTSKLFSMIPAKEVWMAWIYGLCILAVVLWSVADTLHQYQETKNQPLGRTEQVALALCKALRPQDIVLVDTTNAPPFWYYFYLHDISNNYFPSDEVETYGQVYVIVDESEHETFDSVVERQHFNDIIEASTAQTIMNKGALTLFQVQPKATYRTTPIADDSLSENACP